MLAIIGGSGLTTLSNLDVSHREVVRTPYGEPSGPVVFGQICGKPAMFLPRHGYGHTIPPHTVNYRANLWALHHHKATGVISVASVGGIRADLQPEISFCRIRSSITPGGENQPTLMAMARQSRISTLLNPTILICVGGFARLAHNTGSKSRSVVFMPRRRGHALKPAQKLIA